MEATHPIFAVITIVLAVLVILCIIFEPALIRWEEKQMAKLWRKYKEGKKYRR